MKETVVSVATPRIAVGCHSLERLLRILVVVVVPLWKFTVGFLLTQDLKLLLINPCVLVVLPDEVRKEFREQVPARADVIFTPLVFYFFFQGVSGWEQKCCIKPLVSNKR